MRARVLILTIALGSVVLAGCRNRWRPPPSPCPPGATSIPPAGIPDGPPPIAPIPRAEPPSPAPPGGNSELLLPQNPPNKSRSEYRKPIPPSQSGAILGDPDYVEPPKIVESDDAPKAASEKPKPAATPAGIAEFTEVTDGVNTGQRPTIDGLDWLKSNRYKTIVYIHGPDENDTTDRRQIELRDMKYVSLVVTPETLTQKWVEEFTRVVSKEDDRPIFVYGLPDKIGPVWYLYLRTNNYLTHEEARVRAARYGLKDESTEMFKAALKILPPSK